jgi:hypothetical protein
MIFECDCKEHNKIINRKVWLMDYSSENLRQLWEKSKEHRILFSDDVNGDFNKFCSIFLSRDPSSGTIFTNGLVWVVDDFVGVLFMSQIKRSEAMLHFSFFDGRLRFDISKRMIDYIFTEYNFDRLNSEIVPFASRRVFNFVEQLGFKKEGTKRKGLLYKNEKFDLLLYRRWVSNRFS